MFYLTCYLLLSLALYYLFGMHGIVTYSCTVDNGSSVYYCPALESGRVHELNHE